MPDDHVPVPAPSVGAAVAANQAGFGLGRRGENGEGVEPEEIVERFLESGLTFEGHMGLRDGSARPQRQRVQTAGTGHRDRGFGCLVLGSGCPREPALDGDYILTILSIFLARSFSVARLHLSWTRL